MPVSEELLDRAQALDPSAVDALLADVYPLVCRAALALVGHEKLSRRVVQGVLERGMRVLPTWRRGVTPENWFYHHTVITAREAVGSAGTHPDTADDPLVTHAPAPAEPSYIAFVRAVRGLEPQQAEAFILHHGERLNERFLGVAMDCSARAAENHLRAATSALSTLTGGDVAEQAAALPARIALGPSPSDAANAVRPYVRRLIRARRARRVVRLILTLVVLGLLVAIGYALWHWRGTILAK